MTGNMTHVFSEQELLQQTFLQHVEVFDTLASTQDRALELCADPSLMLAALIVTERQTAGRGRDGARWWSPEGALLFSLIVPLPPKFERADSSGQLSLAVARAVADYLQATLQSTDAAEQVRVKPPNDVYLADAKIAGLLIDVPHPPEGCSRREILGIGLNVNNDLSNRPVDIQVPVTSISQQTGRKHDLQESLVSLLDHIEKILMTNDE